MAATATNLRQSAVFLPRILKGLSTLPRNNCSSISGAEMSTSSNGFIFRQMFDEASHTYTYLVGDATSGQAALIDPVLEQATRDLGAVRDLGLQLTLALNTHVHADHVTGTGKLKQLAEGCRSVISESSGAKADLLVKDGDLVKVGSYGLRVLYTPGHTKGCVTYHLEQKALAFTGDALLIRGCGRTDFQEGDSSQLYRSIHERIFSMDGRTLLYPAHDYRGLTCTTVDEERRLNPRLTKTESEFVQIMASLGLPPPAMMDKAVPLNRVCGVFEHN